MNLQIIKLLTLTILFSPAYKSKATTSNEQANINSEKSILDTSDLKYAVKTYKYDLAHPQKKWELPAAIFEISGNTWIDENHLLVIEDLHPNLYLIKLSESNAVIEKTIPFKKRPLATNSMLRM
ncbi:MAG TPA: hypothetical protein VGP55_03145 [Chitinophagaceae bacterium]|nr:hypothetical protein [Chitinophagaceae bacterium]